MGYENQGTGYDSGARGHELQGREGPVDERRERQLASLAKARAARAAKKVLMVAPEGMEITPDMRPGGIVHKRKPPLKKSAKARINEPMGQKHASNDPPDNWLDGIHHAPNGCPHACNATCCVITGENVCAHPDTNLQSKYLTGGFPEVVDRFNAARMEIRRLDAERSLKK